MSTSSDPRDDSSGDHFVWKLSEHKAARLQIEGSMLLAALGGVWPEQPGDVAYRRVLDVGCGVGCWLRQAARSDPRIEKLYGVDANAQMIARARQLAAEEGLDERLEFQVMDALSMLEFPPGYLDLVSIQMGGCTIRTWEWGKLLREFQQVTRHGGLMRVVEQDWLGESTSPALNRLMKMLVETFYRAGHLFRPERTSLLSEMPRLFQQFGIRDVQVKHYPLEFRATTPGWSTYAGHMLPTLTPFLARWGRLPEDYDELCQQALTEMVSADFVARWHFAITWGYK
jgi:SAM-dependent methyltransferase